MILSMIAALSENRVIGSAGQIPWNIPEDLVHVAQLTKGHVLIMGRKTFESLPRLLPNRIHLVITRHPDYAQQNPLAGSSDRVILVSSPESALDAFRDLRKKDPSLPVELFVFGGAEIYRQFMPLSNRLYITLVKREVEGDTFFPLIPHDEWEEVSRQSFPEWDFIEYRRKPPDKFA
jgi:dihydrofolate reductase